jgi:hypothetical protein
MTDSSNVEPGSSVGAPTENEAAPKRCSGATGSAPFTANRKTILVARVIFILCLAHAIAGDLDVPMPYRITHALAFMFVGLVAWWCSEPNSD